MADLETERKPTRATIASRLRYLLVLVSFCGAALASAAGATFSASLDREMITLGESATLSLACGGGDPQGPPAVPQIANLQISYAGQSTQVTMEGAQVSSTITYNFRVIPRQVGDYTIPGITTEIGGEKLVSQPLQLKVLKPTAPPPGAAGSGAQLAFLKLMLPKKEAYVGEAMTAQLQLYLSGRVQNVAGFQITGFPAEGFNVGKMVQGKARQTQVGNSIYTVIPFAYAITAIKAGSYNVGPVTATVVVDVVSANRQRDPFFDRFGFSDFFGRTEQQQVPLLSDSQTVTLLPVPRENAPTNFNGAVGTYTMNVTAGPTNLAEGDPITVKVQISGRGAIESLSLPELSWPNFKTLSQETKVETPDQLGLQGTKTFERIITPEKADVKVIPPIGFSFFDPEQKSFRTLVQPATPLLVRPGGAAPVPSIAGLPRAKQDAPPPTQDIVPNKQRLGSLSQIAPPLIQRPWFVACQGVPIIAFVSLVFWRRRTDNLANNPRLRRQRQVAQTVREGLEQLRRFAAEKKSEDFFATVFRLLQEQLGERLDLPASSITEAVIEEQLRPRGVARATLAPLEQLFQTCNLARYAPVKSSQELAALIPKVEFMLGELAKLKV